MRWDRLRPWACFQGEKTLDSATVPSSPFTLLRCSFPCPKELRGVRIIPEAGGSSCSIAWTDPSPDPHLMLLSGLTCSALIPQAFPATPALHQTSQGFLAPMMAPQTSDFPVSPVNIISTNPAAFLKLLPVFLQGEK